MTGVQPPGEAGPRDNVLLVGLGCCESALQWRQHQYAHDARTPAEDVRVVASEHYGQASGVCVHAVGPARVLWAILVSV